MIQNFECQTVFAAQIFSCGKNCSTLSDKTALPAALQPRLALTERDVANKNAEAAAPVF